MEWKPISSAPKDGRDLWLFVPNEEPSQIVGYWVSDPRGGYWQYREALVADIAGCIEKPTHWQQLPPPPTGAPNE